ncbi:Alpha/Beta hydrolase protein [Aspergillus pseudotamarii]|uniref:feruloyl esterase n=1 Tax=Aspergillus pseudotamarii TaxID=132259 RepID=A0A5N6SLF0_ASPPS|nr:Alpha/Beta hydrolase protein [Aspergillus pseudotamarii]KAE8134727.1 Alpha/Beta hydrolase protein [Aspergillus pseudotamarii]
MHHLGKVLTAFAACAGLGVAAPSSSAQIVPREVSPQFLQQLTLYAQYAAAAYCSANTNSPDTKLTCSVGNCPLVEGANTKTLTEFEDNEAFGDVAGFLAVDESNKQIVLSFRGTRSIETWAANIQLAKEDVDELCDGCKVHTGFWKSWESVATATLDGVKKALQAYPGFKLAVTGHSFGGAVGTIAATALRNSGSKVELYTYGAPRVGNQEFADYVSGQGSNFRVTHSNDIVPRLPPRLLGYHQISPEYWIPVGNNEAVGTADIEMINEADSDMGNAGQKTQSIEAHKWYTDHIYECK